VLRSPDRARESRRKVPVRFIYAYLAQSTDRLGHSGLKANQKVCVDDSGFLAETGDISERQHRNRQCAMPIWNIIAKKILSHFGEYVSCDRIFY